MEQLAINKNLKQCVHCKEYKELVLFHNHKTYPDGLAKECKQCCSKRARTNYAKNDHLKTVIREGMFRRKYNLTITEYEEMFEKQEGLCAICKCPETVTNRGNVRMLAVDHDHNTGKVRGLLCGNCNMALGKMKDDKNLIAAMLEYIIAYEEK